MSTFSLVDQERRTETWNLEKPPSAIGWLTEYLRLMPETRRWDHYSHSVAARDLGRQRLWRTTRAMEAGSLHGRITLGKDLQHPFADGACLQTVGRLLMLGWITSRRPMCSL